jgi:hypothetical protein
MVNDLNTVAYYEQRVKEIEDGYGLGGILTLGGIVAVVGGFASAISTPASADGGAIVATLGILSTLIGFSMLTATPPEGHFVAPSTAALQAYEFNQALKTQLGLPENYEP